MSEEHRQTDIVVSAERVAQFAAQLRQAFRAPDEGGETEAARAMRLRYIFALMRTAEFIRDSAIGKDVASRFFELAAALSDLDAGSVSTLLQPQLNPIGGRRPDGTQVWDARLTAVLGLECIIMSGSTPQSASEQAARKHPTLQRLLRDSSRDLATSLLSWRKSFQDGTVANDAARHSFEYNKPFLSTSLQGRSKSDCLQTARHLLTQAEAKAAALLLKEKI